LFNATDGVQASNQTRPWFVAAGFRDPHLYNDFFIILTRFSRTFQRHPAPHAPCAMFYLVLMLIECWLVLGIRCCLQNLDFRPWRYPGKFAARYPEEVQHTNHSEIPKDPLAPMAWQYPVYFNGNYGNCEELGIAAHPGTRISKLALDDAPCLALRFRVKLMSKPL